MNNKINLALQILPSSEKQHPYAIVDLAIDVIKQSGLKYKVCPFETVIEGTWDQVFEVVRAVHEKCYQNDTQKMMTYIKIQSQFNEDVTIDDKMEKYE